LHPNAFYIINQDNHWRALYKKDNKLHEFDSYNRDILDDIPEGKVAKEYIQGNGSPDTGDCGQRTLTFLHKLYS